jgi:hypothetical protein
MVINVTSDLQPVVATALAQKGVSCWSPYCSVACRVGTVGEALEVARHAQAAARGRLTSAFIDGVKLRLDGSTSPRIETRRGSARVAAAALLQLAESASAEQLFALFGPAISEQLRSMVGAGTEGHTLTAEQARRVLNLVGQDPRKQSGVVLARTQI